MCGDLEEEDAESEMEERLYGLFLRHARFLLSDQMPPASAETIHTYMQRLFSVALGRCVKDAEAAPENHRYATMAAQAVVFARLAGLLAGHSARGDDPLRKSIEALMVGYGESEHGPSEHGHEHGQEHGHHHDHHH